MAFGTVCPDAGLSSLHAEAVFLFGDEWSLICGPAQPKRNATLRRQVEQ
jgi:hypothetical protein